MYAQLVMFTLGPGMRTEAEQMADKFNALHKDIKGFRSATFIGDYANGNFGSLTIWDSPGNLQAAGDILRPKLQEALSGIARGEPSVQIFEVYEPKG